MKKGKIFIISGTAGSGKGSVWAPLLKNPENYYIVKSCTTRKKRSNSDDENKYIFISPDGFNKLISQGKFIEYENVHGDYYGTPNKELEAGIKSGKIVVMEIDVKGALNIKSKYPDAVLIFVRPSSVNVAKERLQKRKTENQKAIRRRVKRYDLELRLSKKFDHIIINNNLAKAQKQLIRIIGKKMRRNKKNSQGL